MREHHPGDPNILSKWDFPVLGSFKMVRADLSSSAPDPKCTVLEMPDDALLHDVT